MIHLSGVTKQYGSRVLYKNGNLQINSGDRTGLVGPNGAGKTTLFKIITGEERVDSGHVTLPDRVVVGYFKQDVGEMSGRSALEEVKAGVARVSELGVQLAEMEKRLESSAVDPLPDDEMASLLEKYGDAQLEFEQSGGYDLDARAKEILTGLGIGPGDYDQPVENFSGGWKMRIALARILTLRPDVLLMDEPTNHLDVESIVWLEEWLKSFKGALFMTCHDREFMNRSVHKVIEVANQAISAYNGNYDFYEREREVRRNQLLAAHRRQKEMLSKEEEFIARFAARASHAAQVQSRVKKLEKIERIEIPAEQKVIQFDFATPPRSGDNVVKFENVEKQWTRDDGQTKPVFSGASAMVKRLDKVAIVGVNGAGKSTLLKCVAGMTEPTSGRLTIGAGVKMGYFSQQSMDVLNPRNTVEEEFQTHVPTAGIGFVRNLLGAFLFSGDDVKKKVSVLSGGERSRLVLATIFAKPVNLLVLDEPTNHLDIATRDILLKMLQDFEGTVLLVSHDRYFLSQMTKRVFELDHGEIRIYEGTYDDYLRRRAVGG